MLLGVHGHGTAGSTRVLPDMPPGRCQPMPSTQNALQSCPKIFNWPIISVESIFTIPSVSGLFPFVVGCVGSTSTREGKVIVGSEF